MKIPFARIAILTAALSGAALSAHAQTAQPYPADGKLVRIGDRDMARTVTVYTADLQTEAGARKVYDHLRAVAAQVCGADGDAPDWVLAQDQACVDEALVNAVADLHSAPLRQVLRAGADTAAPAYARSDR